MDARHKSGYDRMSGMSTNNKVAIIGAGIGGLTAALALIRQGIGVDIYEQAPELKELGAGVQISSNGTRVLDALGLGAEAERLGVVVAGKEIRLWSTGQTWKLFDLGAVSVERYGSPYMMFHRGDLHTVLLDAIRRERPDAIHLDRKCVGLTQNADTVTINFERGEAATAPLVRSRLSSVLTVLSDQFWSPATAVAISSALIGLLAQSASIIRLSAVLMRMDYTCNSLYRLQT